MDIILKEKDYAENAISENLLDEKKPTKTLIILTKYYFKNGMNKEQIRVQLESFMEKNYKDFNSSGWANVLDRIVKTFASDKFKLTDIENIEITANELNKIRQLDNLKLERLAFVLLVYVKVLNKINDENNNWISLSKNEMYKDTLLKDTGKNMKLVYKSLIDKDYLGMALKVNNTSIQVKYIDDNSDVELIISDFRNFVLKYLQWRDGAGVDITNCDECGQLIVKTSNRKKFCVQCWKEEEKIQTRERVRRHRKLKDVTV